MNFRQIEAFRAVMLGGSATAAAQMLFVSQPAVSRLIHNLEHSAGFLLFERRKKRLVPTPEGKQFYAAVEQTFVGLDHINKAANAIRTASVGTLRIASTPLVAHGILCRVVGDFLKMNPNVFVEMAHGSREFVIECVASQIYDLGIEVPPIRNAAVREEVLVTHRAICVLHRDHELKSKKSVSVKDLGKFDFVAPETGSMFRFAVDQAFKVAGISPRIRAETTTQTAICGLAAKGVGVAIVAPYVVPSTLGMPLTFRPLKPEIPISYSALLPSLRSSSLLADKFYAFMKAELQVGGSVAR
jgi:DNA-binding transcriptional LysR family regulator